MPWKPSVRAGRDGGGSGSGCFLGQLVGLGVGHVADLARGFTAVLDPAADGIMFERGGVDVERFVEVGPPLALHLREVDAVLRPLGAGQARLDRAEVELELSV